MTDNSLLKLEEKIMALLSTLENLRSEAHQLKQENAAFKAEKINNTKRLQELVDLLDSVDPVTSQEVEEFALI